ncbi:MAG: UDP-glucose/GDP-mannose dehydrogenase family protein [Asgard group archaeon]|nr:UDP-glucose/GDP-mannose dehydrogenase family protein [Asgard group archaeon]
MNPEVKITITGTGFVGLVTAAVFADKGFNVVALDIDKKKVDTVNKGETFFFEPNLPPLIQRVVLKKKTLTASTDIVESIKASDVTFICVGTPSLEDGSCDLQYIEQSARDIGRAIKQKNDYHLVVAKSTIVPGTTRKLIKQTIEEVSGKKAGEDFGLCMSPEFLREGQSVHDTVYPDRIVIGEHHKKSGEMLEGIFKELYKEEVDEYTKNWEAIYNKKVLCPEILRFSLETAECIKYANNSFLATKISFINEFANICERIDGVDINNIAKGIGLDFRINPRFLRAGAGFGGSCFPKDVRAIMKFAKNAEYDPKILNSVIEVNAHQAKRMVELAEEKMGDLSGKKVCVLGLSFKPETDDMRSAPSIKIINHLLSKGAEIIAYDPKAMEEAKKEHWIGEKIEYASSIQDALKDADVCLLITEWNEFRNLEPRDFKSMKNPILIDGRRIYEPKKFLKEGIKYSGIGIGLKNN